MGFHSPHMQSEAPLVGAAKTRRRRLPSPAEQQRRKAWGAKYSVLVRNAVREVIPEKEKR